MRPSWLAAVHPALGVRTMWQHDCVHAHGPSQALPGSAESSVKYRCGYGMPRVLMREPWEEANALRSPCPWVSQPHPCAILAPRWDPPRTPEGRAQSLPGRILFESLRCILSGSLADPFRDHPPLVLSPTHRKDDDRMQLKDPTEQRTAGDDGRMHGMRRGSF